MKHAGGRPTIYTEELVEEAKLYLEERKDEIEEYHKTRGEKSDTYERLVHVRLPTLEGLALRLKVSRETLYAWEKEHQEFSDILGDIRAAQAERLINGSLSGEYNPLISKLLLSKHGYIEKQDVTSDGKALPTPILGYVPKDNSITEDTETEEED